MREEKKMHEIFEKVLARISPSEEEREHDRRFADGIRWSIKNEVPRCIDVKLMGSVAKGTNLKTGRDFDIFILFPKHYPHHDMAMLGLHYAKKAVAEHRHEVRYAEHPYLRAVVKGFKVDIVPCYKINNIAEKGSSVDRSQLHTAYIIGNLSDEQKGGVRLLKQFMKTLGVYGAELRVEGFSGYLCELLIMKYGSLPGLMKAAAHEWDRPVIDIENHHAGKDLSKIFDSPLIVIDPVDKNRNVAAVVSHTSLNRFIFACRQFLASPSEGFFFKEKEIHSPAKLKKLMKHRKTRLFVLNFRSPDVVDDILWPQLKKTGAALTRALESEGFRVFGSYYWSDGKECLLITELSVWELPEVRRVFGPSIKFRKDVEQFIATHRDRALNIHVEHDKVLAIVPRKETSAQKTIKDFLADSGKHGVPENFKPLLKKAKFLKPEALLKKKYLEVASDYFTRTVI